MVILNPNTSGQGFCAAHAAHPFHPIALEFGYTYSHSVLVRHYSGAGNRMHHCYKFGEHNLSFFVYAADERGREEQVSKSWETSTSCASGHKHEKCGEFSLRRHLTYKRNKYKLK